jgi:hypothetical protein
VRWWIPARSRRSLIPRRRSTCGRSVETVRTAPYFNVGDIWSGRPNTGVHPKGMRERHGHATIGITLDAYGHVAPGLHDDAAERVAACSARLANH